MRTLLLTAALLAGAAVSPTQDTGGSVPPAAELQQQFFAARDQWNRDYRVALAAKDMDEAARLRAHRPQAEFLPRFEAGALANAGTETAVPYLAWLVSHGPTDAASSAMTTLMDDHVASPGIRLAVARIGGLNRSFGLERSRQWLDRVLEHNRDAHVQAQARYTRAAMHVGTRAVSTSPALRGLAIADLEAASAQLTDLEDGASLAGLVARLLDEARRLEPGLEAPEIEGEDLDGVPFKLSDYRGKVVLLDFWGDW